MEEVEGRVTSLPASYRPDVGGGEENQVRNDENSALRTSKV